MPESHSRSSSHSSTKTSRSSSRHSSGSSHSNSKEGIRLHVADLGLGVSKRELERVFDRYGRVKEVFLARTPPCFAFVIYENKSDAADAVKGVDGHIIGGHRVRVTYALPRTRGRGRRFDPSMRCFQCGQRGHFCRDCNNTKYGFRRSPYGSPSHNRRRSGRERYRSTSRTRYRSRSNSRGRTRRDE